MKHLLNDISLDNLNTFNVHAKAKAFIQIDSLSHIESVYKKISAYKERFVLGGGSNVLFVGDYFGLVIYPQLKGIEVLQEDEVKVALRVAASEPWHDFVCYCLKQKYYGLENLALIPGTVGAAPVQNIGAYGVEVESFITQVKCFDLQSGKVKILSHQECQFEYRDSVIKRAGQGRFVVLSVDFVLNKKPDLVLTYKPLKEYFKDQSDISPDQVFKRVCEIRSEKLPDPGKLANAGSFFKNPIVSEAKHRAIKMIFPELVAYPAQLDQKPVFKVAAGWLIERAGFKGKVVGKVGVHKQQALVLVNYSDTDGANIFALAKTIMRAVKQKFDVQLEVEVRVLGGAPKKEAVIDEKI